MKALLDSFFPLLLLFCVLVLSLCALILFSLRYFQKKLVRKKRKSEELKNFEKIPEDLSKMMQKVNLTTLSSLIQKQPPSTIALMLSYLEKDRQEALLAKLPSSIQEEVLTYLTQRGDV